MSEFPFLEEDLNILIDNSLDTPAPEAGSIDNLPTFLNEFIEENVNKVIESQLPKTFNTILENPVFPAAPEVAPVPVAISTPVSTPAIKKLNIDDLAVAGPSPISHINHRKRRAAVMSPEAVVCLNNFINDCDTERRMHTYLTIGADGQPKKAQVFHEDSRAMSRNIYWRMMEYLWRLIQSHQWVRPIIPHRVTHKNTLPKPFF